MKKLGQDLVYQVGRFGPVRGNGSVAAVQWVLSGLFDRFPNLRIFFAENQIGWIPFSCRPRTCVMIAMSDGPSACSASNLCAVCRANTFANIFSGAFSSTGSASSCATRSTSTV